SRSHGQKVQLPLHVKRSSNCGDQLNTTTCGPHGHRPIPGTSKDPGPELSRVRHWKRTSWGPVSTTGVRTRNYERATSQTTQTSTVQHKYRDKAPS
ncbi:hypothetical protein Taro_025266, partial [Colocasia esculenta]|nr:hypothetical protein [Colocasia esculenta]